MRWSVAESPAGENLTITWRPAVIVQNLGCSPPADEPGWVPRMACSANCG